MKYETLITDSAGHLSLYQPQRMSRDVFDFSQRIAQVPLHSFNLNEQAASLRLNHRLAEEPKKSLSIDSGLVNPSWFRVSGNNFQLSFALDDQLITAMAQWFRFESPIDRLAPTALNALCVAGIEYLITHAFGEVVHRITPCGSAPIEVDNCQLVRGIFQFGQTEYPLLFVINEAFLSVANDFLSQISSQPQKLSNEFLHIPLLTQFILDEFVIAGHDLISLSAGDLLVVSAKQDTVLVRVQQLQQRGRIVDNQVTLDGYLESFEKDLSNQQTNQSLERPRLEAETFDADRTAADLGIQLPAFTADQQATQGQKKRMTQEDLINDIPVEVTFELGRQTLTLEEIQSLNHGQCLPINPLDPQKVSILVNGMKYAQGEIVQIDQEIAVRITQLNS